MCNHEPHVVPINMKNRFSFRALAFLVALAVRLIHLPVIYFWCSLGSSIGGTPAINAALALPLGIAVWHGWQLWRRTKQPDLASDESAKLEELIWLLEHRYVSGYLLRAWRYFVTEPVLAKEFREEILDPIVRWNTGCFFVGWLWGFIDKFSNDPASGISLDFVGEWARVGDGILDGLWSVLVLFAVQVVLFALYLVITLFADDSTLGMMTKVDQAKR